MYIIIYLKIYVFIHVLFSKYININNHLMTDTDGRTADEVVVKYRGGGAGTTTFQ